MSQTFYTKHNFIFYTARGGGQTYTEDNIAVSKNDIRCLIFLIFVKRFSKVGLRERKAVMVHRLWGCMFNTVTSNFSHCFKLFVVLSHKVICGINYVDILAWWCWSGWVYYLSCSVVVLCIVMFCIMCSFLLFLWYLKCK